MLGSDRGWKPLLILNLHALSKHNPAPCCRVVIIGGGYAALSAAITLHQQFPSSQVTLLAPRKAHIKATRLHETLRYSLLHLCVPYAELGKRFGFRFIQAKLKFTPENLLRWQHQAFISTNSENLPFDYLIIATGATPIASAPADNLLNIGDFFSNRAQTRLKEFCTHRRPAYISVIGGGASGIQFLFELAESLKHHKNRFIKLRLITHSATVLNMLPRPFHDYVYARIRQNGIDYLPNTSFIRQEGENLILATQDSGLELSLPSALSLQCLGVKAYPIPIETNGYGQIIVQGQTLQTLFAAGDCARFSGSGANSLSAQVALRKGRAVALNLLNHATGRTLSAYDYREKGYFVGLGKADCIGWLGTPDNIKTGLPAMAIKKASETQYDLLLSGVYQID
jgi:NADH dehydrogenase